mgnify:CR=1 FL=1
MAQKKIKSATDQRKFIIIYHDFLESNLLTSHEKMVFIALKKFADSNNQCFPSLKKLANITQISKRKIQDILKSLEQKHVIGIESRSRTDGGDTSNLYTLYDFKELWNAGSSEEVAAVIDGIKEKHMIEILTAKGYCITKEKETTSAPTKVTDVDSNKNSSDINKDNTKESKSQELERYTMMDIKVLYEYDSLIIQYPAKQTDIDIIFDILYDTLNSTKQTIRISGENKPSMIVIGKLMKLQPDDLIYSIDKYHEQTNRIKNVKGYLLTMLYNSREQQHLDVMNLGHYNGDF